MKLSRIQKDIIDTIKKIETGKIVPTEKEDFEPNKPNARFIWRVLGTTYTKKQFRKAINRMLKLGVLTMVQENKNNVIIKIKDNGNK